MKKTNAVAGENDGNGNNKTFMFVFITTTFKEIFLD